LQLNCMYFRVAHENYEMRHARNGLGYTWKHMLQQPSSPVVWRKHPELLVSWKNLQVCVNI
jgi:hypothetical protein